MIHFWHMIALRANHDILNRSHTSLQTLRLKARRMVLQFGRGVAGASVPAWVLLASSMPMAGAEAADPPNPVVRKPPTYSADVEPIVRDRCRECHRPGQVAPFPLLTFEQASRRAGDLAAVAEERRMPPWKPTPGFGPKLRHDRSLPPAEIATLRAWADSGARRGSAEKTGVPTRLRRRLDARSARRRARTGGGV